MGAKIEDRKIQEKIERVKDDFSRTAMEGMDIDWLYELPRQQEDLPTDAEEIRKQIKAKGKEIR